VCRLAARVFAGGSALLLTSTFVLAQDTEPPPAAPRLTWRANLEWITAMRGTDLAETPLNPGNAAFGLPQLVTLTELRPNVRVEAGSRWQVVFRPRWRGTASFTRTEDEPRRNQVEGTFNVPELYVNWRPTDVVSIAYGLQNFQWGPAELLSPSNRVFHEVGTFRDPLYYVRGRHMVRVNVSAGKQWSAVALAEVGATDEPAFRAGEHFAPAGQAKMEYTTASGDGYVGVTGGARQGERPWFGEYVSVTLVAGLSAYVDAVHQQGSLAWYPVGGPRGAAFVQLDRGSGAVRTLVVGGLRYSFVNGTDARVEYMHQDAGYRRSQFALAALAVATQPSRETADRWLRPGLEFAGRDLVLGSVRVPAVPPVRRVGLHAQYLASLTDRSGLVYATTTVDASGALVVFGTVTATYGDDVAEFSRLVRASVVGGVVWSW
jgi:hypothetical protein